MYEYNCRNVKTGEEEIFFGYTFKDATKNCDQAGDLVIVFRDYID